MPMPINARKENLGQAYVRTVVAAVGYNLSKDENDFGLDGTIKDVAVRGNRYYNSGFNIEYQLKSSWDVTFDGNDLIYDLESKNYNDLASWDGAVPAILILFVLPRDEHEWIDFSREGISIHNCAWWCSLAGQPVTENETTKRIRIPINQVFSPNALEELMAKVRRGENL